MSIKWKRLTMPELGPLTHLRRCYRFTSARSSNFWSSSQHLDFVLVVANDNRSRRFRLFPRSKNIFAVEIPWLTANGHDVTSSHVSMDTLMRVLPIGLWSLAKFVI